MTQKLLYITLFFAATLSCSSSGEKLEVPKKFSKTVGLKESEKEKYRKLLQPYYDSLKRTGFSGGIIVAKKGDIILEDYTGYFDWKQKIPIESNTPLHVASVSKTFTAIAMLHFWENEDFHLDDPVQKYFPEFPYKDITIHSLLSHRSGLPNYANLMTDYTTTVRYVKNKRGKKVPVTTRKKVAPFVEGYVENKDVLRYFAVKKPGLVFRPNSRFQYCNSNYVLLALLLEKFSGKPYPQLMKDLIFDPLGMKDSYIFDKSQVPNYQPSYFANLRPYPIDKFDCLYGDKNVYTTARDLLLWEQGLAQHKIISPETLSMAYEPQSFEKPGIHNYGLGWRMILYPEKKVIYHNGWWHGNNAVFTRLVDDNATIIITGNRYNEAIYRFGRRMNNAFFSVSDTTLLEEMP